ncbi:hypothetical protein ACOSP7_008547 [Xanthoceras sorbifolium]
MGRSPCSMSKKELNRGAWTALEDKILKDYIENNDAGSVDPPVPSSLLDENVLIEPSINNGVFEAAEWGFSDELLPIIACGDDSLRDLMIDVNESWQIISLSEALQTDEVDKLCDRNATMIDNEESFYVRNWNSEDSFHQFESDLDLW